MRLTATVACVIVGLDCANKAVGNDPQKLFAPDNIWVWWIFAGLWTLAGMRVLLNGVE